MLVLVMIPTAYEILTKLSMCLPASMKLAKFKHYELDIRISPLPHYREIGEDANGNPIRRWVETSSSQFFPERRTTRAREREREN